MSAVLKLFVQGGRGSGADRGRTAKVKRKQKKVVTKVNKVVSGAELALMKYFRSAGMFHTMIFF